ncbi:hypothetical protein KC352_g34252, partial [Hortaea werneckii]
VWQDPRWEDEKASNASVSAPTDDEYKAKLKSKKNPNIHRRVDIIIAPWRCVGCAVLSWSGETTFQRDLRRYCKEVRGWKFDSSGIRQYGTGEVVDVEGKKTAGAGGDGQEEGKGKAEGMEEAERRVFEALELEYRRPEERCTG